MYKKKVIVGMSGGVDSSVAAWILKKEGFDVQGLFMQNWIDDDDEFCHSKKDLIDAISIADLIGINIEIVNFSKEYKNYVFKDFIKEYKAGRTPNPDVFCNSEIKFKAFLNYAIKLGADLIATGHYARIKEINGIFKLLKGKDSCKDQSYFLYRLNQSQLSKTIFPIGDYDKKVIRKIAVELAFPNAKKKDSTGICFIGKRPFKNFLNKYVSFKPGPMLTPDDKKVGEHIGLSFYTLGQRKGLGLGALKGEKTKNGPWYVVSKNINKNILYVAQNYHHPWLLTNKLKASEVNWLSGKPPQKNKLSVKTRYRQQAIFCTHQALPKGNFGLFFDEPQWAVTPGQSAVLYDGDVCIGGGIID